MGYELNQNRNTVKKEGTQSKEKIGKLEISIQSTSEASGQRGHHHQNRERMVSKQRGEKNPTTQQNPGEKSEGKISETFGETFSDTFSETFSETFQRKHRFQILTWRKNRFRHEERILLFSFLVFSF